MPSCLNRIGSWPADVHKAIAKKEILVISEKDAINFIHGSENKNKVSLYVSNDAVHVGILSLTSGKMSDMESHEGDEAGWVLDGSIQIIASKSKGSEKSVFQECYSLKTDGTNGGALCEPAQQDFEIEAHETVVADASFVGDMTEGVESGLDRFIVKILHPNKGVHDDDDPYDDPALILMQEAILCPPALTDELLHLIASELE